MMGPGFAYMPPADQRGNAKAILDERLARGDIDQEEYRSRA